MNTLFALVVLMMAQAVGAAELKMRPFQVTDQQGKPTGYAVTLPDLPDFSSAMTISNHATGMLAKIYPDVIALSECFHLMGLFVVNKSATTDRFHFTSIKDFVQNDFHNKKSLKSELSSKIIEQKHGGYDAYLMTKTRFSKPIRKSLYYIVEIGDRFFAFEYTYFHRRDAERVDDCRDAYLDQFQSYSKSLAPAPPAAR